MTPTACRVPLVVAYGNALRGDDGVGWAVAERLAEDPRLAGAEIRAAHQLTPEVALDASDASLLVLVDACVDAPAGAVTVRRLDASATGGTAWSHHVDAGTLLALAGELWGTAPPAWVVSIGAATMEAGHCLSPAVADAVPVAADAVAALVEEHARA